MCAGVRAVLKWLQVMSGAVGVKGTVWSTVALTRAVSTGAEGAGRCTGDVLGEGEGMRRSIGG